MDSTLWCPCHGRVNQFPYLAGNFAVTVDDSKRCTHCTHCTTLMNAFETRLGRHTAQPTPISCCTPLLCFATPLAARLYYSCHISVSSRCAANFWRLDASSQQPFDNTLHTRSLTTPATCDAAGCAFIHFRFRFTAFMPHAHTHTHARRYAPTVWRLGTNLLSVSVFFFAFQTKTSPLLCSVGRSLLLLLLLLLLF